MREKKGEKNSVGGRRASVFFTPLPPLILSAWVTGMPVQDLCSASMVASFRMSSFLLNKALKLVDWNSIFDYLQTVGT